MAEAERQPNDAKGSDKTARRREELDQLLERISAHISSAGQSPELPDGNAAATAPASGDEAMPSPEPAAPLSAHRHAPEGEEPPALRSAIPAGERSKAPQTAAAPSTPRRTPKPEIQIPSAIARSPEPDMRIEATDTPWDAASAEALTRTWETEAAVPTLRSAHHAMSSHAPASVRRPAPAVEPPRVSAGDVEMAESELLAAARRVEAALDRLAPREDVAALAGRFSGLETRVVDLGAKLDDDNIVALFGKLVPTADELTQFAEDAASRAADRVLEAHATRSASEPSTHRSASPDHAALSGLLDTFMEERRRNDASTFEALETLQLAMQHLLDRLELAESRGASPALPAAPSPHHGAVLEAEDGLDHTPMPDPEPVPQFRAPAAEFGAAHLVQAPHHAEPPAYTPPSAHHQPASMPRTVDSDALGMAVGAVAAEMRSANAHQHAVEAPGQPQPAAAPPLNERQAMIAMARRAAQKATADAGNPAAQAAAKGAHDRAPIASAALAAKASGAIRPGVFVVVALAAIMLAGYFMASSRFGILRSSAPVAQRAVTVEPEPQPAPARAPAASGRPDVDGNDAPPAAQPPAQPAAPRKTSLDEAPEEPTNDIQRARVITGSIEATGPGISVTQEGRAPTVTDVMRANERARLAGLSERTGYTAAQSMGRPPATSPIETASTGAAPQASPSVVEPQMQAQGASRQLPLPPVTTGPLSLRLAAAQGNPAAQLEVATRLAEGKGVKQDFAEAVVWYRRAAEQGMAVAQYRLATLFERGMGVKADPAQARAWYTRAAEQGNLKAMHNMAVLAANTAGGHPDYTSAANYFTQAAERGLTDSQYNLGVLYESGLGVPRDHAAAYKWYSLAARGGDSEAARRRDQLIARLPAQTIEATDRQIVEWRPLASSEIANNAFLAGESWKQQSQAQPQARTIRVSQ